MDEPEGPWPSPRGNASLTQDAAVGVSGRVQLLLEILMVLMCVGAVAGTSVFLLVYSVFYESRNICGSSPQSEHMSNTVCSLESDSYCC